MSDPLDLDHAIATAIIGVDTLWGGDVNCASGTGRFIADSWFSDQELPVAYSHPTAAALRESGGVSASAPDAAAVAAYLAAVDIPAAIASVGDGGTRVGGDRGAYLTGLASCFDVMWDLAMEIVGRGAPVPYQRCVSTVTGAAPQPSDPGRKRERVAELLGSAADGLGAAVDAWRQRHLVAKSDIAAQGAALIARYDALTAANVLPYLPPAWAEVPRANVVFLPIENAWFSGSMNYLGRARRPDGSPEYEATYELNAALEISAPEFAQLVSHEVVPGHVTTFAYLQHGYVRGELGFEATVLTMNTRVAALFEGIANNAILMAHGITEVDAIDDPDLELGVLLALLQDDAKNQSSYLTWEEGREQERVAEVLRADYLVSAERADKLSGAWGRHPLLGRMYLPAYRAGTELVADLRRTHAPERVLPALYGASGLVDVVTIGDLLAG